MTAGTYPYNGIEKRMKSPRENPIHSATAAAGVLLIYLFAAPLCATAQTAPSTQYEATGRILISHHTSISKTESIDELTKRHTDLFGSPKHIEKAIQSFDLLTLQSVAAIPPTERTSRIARNLTVSAKPSLDFPKAVVLEFKYRSDSPDAFVVVIALEYSYGKFQVHEPPPFDEKAEQCFLLVAKQEKLKIEAKRLRKKGAETELAQTEQRIAEIQRDLEKMGWKPEPEFSKPQDFDVIQLLHPWESTEIKGNGSN